MVAGPLRPSSSAFTFIGSDPASDPAGQRLRPVVIASRIAPPYAPHPASRARHSSHTSRCFLDRRVVVQAIQRVEFEVVPGLGGLRMPVSSIGPRGAGGALQSRFRWPGSISPTKI